ncbi:MAG: FtsX-like permease family protein [Pseudomonadota bacterium]
MSPRWMKIVRDIRLTRGRLLMIVIAQAVSIAAVTTMLSAYTVLTREVPRNYIGTNPASAQLEMAANLDEQLLQQVRARPDIAAVEAAAVVIARVEVGPGEWLPARLFVVPSFEGLRINTLHRESGAWPPPAGTLLVERSALPLTRTALGRPMMVEFQRSGRHAINIAGTVHDPGLAPAWQEQTIYGYVTPQTLAQLGEAAPLKLLKVVVAEGADDAQAIDTTIRALASWLGDNGHQVLEARIPPPRLHPHQAQMNAILVMLLIFSLLALLLGAVLTATVVGGLLAQQVRQIAIMKAVGARQRQVAGLYLGLVGVLGMSAVAIGMPLGLLAGRGFIAIIAELLNLRIDSLALPWWLLAATPLIGLAIPLVAALIPILAAARRTVQDAIQDHDVSRDALNSSWTSRWMARIRIRDVALNLALRNMVRRRARLVLTMSLLAGAGAMFVTSLNLKAAWENNVSQSAADRHFDLELYLQQAAPLERIQALAATASQVSRVEAWSASPAAIAGSDGLEVVHRYPDGAHGSFTLRAAPPDTALFAHSMVAGRWLQAQDEQVAVINTLAKAIAFPGVKVGDYITLSTAHSPLRLRVAGITRELLTPGAVYVMPATFGQATDTHGLANAVRIALADRRQADAAASAIVRALEREHIGVKAVVTEKNFAAAQGGHVYILVFALGFIASMMAVVGLLGLASSLGTAVIERTREFGVMRAIGARSAVVTRSVLYEGVLTGLLSALFAALLAVLPSLLVGRVLASISVQELSLQLSPSGIALWLGLVLAGSMAVSYYPATRASQLTVKQTLTLEYA